jgi:hypothetical protein
MTFEPQDLSAKLSPIPTCRVEANGSDAPQPSFHEAKLLRALSARLFSLLMGLDHLLANRARRHNEKVLQAIVKCD